MKPGDLVQILPGAHGYSDGWRRGEDPTHFPDGTMGILLEVNPPDAYWDPRTFLRVATSSGCVSIFDGFTRMIQ